MELDRSHDPEREPGPINLQRYAFVPAYAGIATFFGVPLCLNQDDLRGGDVDVAVLGAPVDMGLGHRGAAYGPRALRGDERILPNVPQGLVNPSTRIRPFGELTVVDYGDAADHSILWPDAAAVADVYGPGKVGVVHFDAHPDCHDDMFGHLVTHTTPIRRVIEDEHAARLRRATGFRADLIRRHGQRTVSGQPPRHLDDRQVHPDLAPGGSPLSASEGLLVRAG